MAEQTKIQWTDHTFNPWWGCTKISPGCKHCYAEGIATRYTPGVWGVTGKRKVSGAATWAEPERWNRATLKSGRRARVFCASMADVFEDSQQIEAARLQLWALIERTPALDWLLLTKRPANVLRMIPNHWQSEPLPNVWYGTSVEDTLRAEERIPALLEIPAYVRFLSCEPLLEAVNLAPYLHGLQWVITGGESGAQARPAAPDWFRSICNDCQAAGIAYFHKQNGGKGKGKGGELLDGQLWHAWPKEVTIGSYRRSSTISTSHGRDKTGAA